MSLENRKGDNNRKERTANVILFAGNKAKSEIDIKDMIQTLKKNIRKPCYECK